MKVVLNIPLLLLVTLFFKGCNKGLDYNPIYLATNYITIKCDA
jgi:hypothetical protein